MAARCCGDSRQEGGAYWECGLSGSGRPLEDFILCSPQIVPEEMGISPLGVTLFEQPNRPGVYHIADWVGSVHYPNVWDFLEEVRVLGLSRRLSKNLDFSKLSKDSRIILCHHKAHIDNLQEWPEWYCPKEIEGHSDPKDSDDISEVFQWLTEAGLSCAGAWAEDTDEGAEVSTAERIDLWGKVIPGPWYGPGIDVEDTRIVKRNLPSLSYYARRRPEGINPVYKTAFFASFPASRLVVVRGEDSDETLDKLSASRLRVEEVPE